VFHCICTWSKWTRTRRCQSFRKSKHRSQYFCGPVSISKGWRSRLWGICWLCLIAIVSVFLQCREERGGRCVVGRRMLVVDFRNRDVKFARIFGSVREGKLARIMMLVPCSLILDPSLMPCSASGRTFIRF
jgi:hypothetical protein